MPGFGLVGVGQPVFGALGELANGTAQKVLRFELRRRSRTGEHAEDENADGHGTESHVAMA